MHTFTPREHVNFRKLNSKCIYLKEQLWILLCQIQVYTELPMKYLLGHNFTKKIVFVPNSTTTTSNKETFLQDMFVLNTRKIVEELLRYYMHSNVLECGQTTIVIFT